MTLRRVDDKGQSGDALAVVDVLPGIAGCRHWVSLAEPALLAFRDAIGLLAAIFGGLFALGLAAAFSWRPALALFALAGVALAGVALKAAGASPCAAIVDSCRFVYDDAGKSSR